MLCLQINQRQILDFRCPLIGAGYTLQNAFSSQAVFKPRVLFVIDARRSPRISRSVVRE